MTARQVDQSKKYINMKVLSLCLQNSKIHWIKTKKVRLTRLICHIYKVIYTRACISYTFVQNNICNWWPVFSLLQEDNIPYSRSTYLIDPPTSFEQQQRYSNTFTNARAYIEDPMSLYSVVHKDRKNNGQNNQRNSLLIQNNQNTPPDSSDSPCSIEQHIHNYEDTESEYACELRRQTYLQKIGKS